jgi:hypothetical protein
MRNNAGAEGDLVAGLARTTRPRQWYGDYRPYGERLKMESVSKWRASQTKSRLAG